jgi:hypothetical protein
MAQQVILTNLDAMSFEVHQNIPITLIIMRRVIEFYTPQFTETNILSKLLTPEEILTRKFTEWIREYIELYQCACDTQIRFRVTFTLKSMFDFLSHTNTQFLQSFEVLTRRPLTEEYLWEIRTINRINTQDAARNFLSSVIGG